MSDGGRVTAAVADLRAEVAELDRLVAGRSEAELDQPTPFYGWRAKDVLGHLTFIDRLALLAVTDPAACAARVKAMGEGTKADGDTTEAGVFRRLLAHETRTLAIDSGIERLAAWREASAALTQALEGEDVGRQLEWFGRPMKLGTLISARQMETWGYGTDIFDLFRARRTESDRLKNVADFATKTFRFAFANRGLQTDGPPRLELTAPSGATWVWNADAGEGLISGPAVDFCLVCTQRRHVDDTALNTEGETARRWLEIAQCIAGAPVSGPAPGERAWA